jgi:hypothetical protein
MSRNIMFVLVYHRHKLLGLNQIKMLNIYMNLCSGILLRCFIVMKVWRLAGRRFPDLVLVDNIFFFSQRASCCVSQANGMVRFPSTQEYGYTISQYSDWIFIATCFSLQATVIRQ